VDVQFDSTYYVQHFTTNMNDILQRAYPMNNVHFRTIIFCRDSLSSRDQFQENNPKTVNITLFSQLLICIVPVRGYALLAKHIQEETCDFFF
jgi:hypothetical protein